MPHDAVSGPSKTEHAGRVRLDLEGFLLQLSPFQAMLLRATQSTRIHMKKKNSMVPKLLNSDSHLELFRNTLPTGYFPNPFRLILSHSNLWLGSSVCSAGPLDDWKEPAKVWGPRVYLTPLSSRELTAKPGAEMGPREAWVCFPPSSLSGVTSVVAVCCKTRHCFLLGGLTITPRAEILPSDAWVELGQQGTSLA